MLKTCDAAAVEDTGMTTWKINVNSTGTAAFGPSRYLMLLRKDECT